MRILMLDLDTLRPDHLGCYGYHRNTSPNIDAIAEKATRFNNYYCSDAPCLPARAANWSGRHGIRTGVIGHGGTPADMRLEGAPRGFRDQMAFTSLPAMLKQEGFHTCTISPFGERHAAWWFYSAFKEVHNTGKGGNESAEEISPVVMDWLDRKGKDDNWFLHINYWDPHTMYRAPADFGNPFENEPIPAWLTEDVLKEHLQHVGPHSAREMNMFDSRPMPQYPRHQPEIKDMATLKANIDGYDCGIAYLDQHLGRIFEKLEALGVMDDTAVIITSDHGENQGELGIYAEHGTSDYITHHIPMIIKWPGMQAGATDDGMHYNLDLLPTLKELLGSKVEGDWDGQSYAATLKEGKDTGRAFLALGQGCHVCQRSVRFGDYQYIRTYHDGYHMFPQEMLFNVAEDPHEQHDLAEEKPEVCGLALRHLTAWSDEMMQKNAANGYDMDPIWTVIKEGGPMHARGRGAAYVERLKETGRGWAVEELQKRHPLEFAPGKKPWDK